MAPYFLGHIANRCNRGNVAIHGIDGFKCNQLGPLGINGLQFGFKVGHIIVGENDAFGLAVANTLDHRGVVACIRQHNAIRNERSKGAKRGPV